ncbi:MAG: metal ABC transporter permease [Eubacteriales bacterium]
MTVELLGDYSFQVVATGAALLGIMSGMIGCFALLRKEGLLGDGIAHATLPGVYLGFLFFGSHETEWLLLGGLFTGILASYMIFFMIKNSKIKFDAALALILSLFFGFAMVLKTYVSGSAQGGQSGLDRFVYGQASAILLEDVKMIAVSTIFLGITLCYFWKEFTLITFDAEFAQVSGIPCRKIELLLHFLLVFVIVLGMQTVGVILMSAMLVNPAVAARQWVQHLRGMVLLSAVFGSISAVIGTFFSSSVSNLPTGPVIVLCGSMITFFSILFAPKRGVFFQIHQRKRKKRELTAALSKEMQKGRGDL